MAEDRSQLEPLTHSPTCRQRLRRWLAEDQSQTEMTKWQTIMTKLDVFTYVPVPRSQPVSTKRSKLGSLLLVGIFLVYVVYDFISLVSNNPPKVNTYQLPLQDRPYAVPEMAIGFIYGKQLNETLNDPTYMSISLVEITTTQGKGVPTDAELYMCPKLDWMGEQQLFYKDLLCMNSQNVSLEGILYASTVSRYPRYIVTACNSSLNATPKCKDRDQLFEMTSGGRMFLFIEKNQSVNLATLEAANHTLGGFSFYNLFLVPGLYNRLTITFQPTTYIIYPDYITSFSKRIVQTMPIVDEMFQTSNVSKYNELDLLSISILISSSTKVNEVVYSNLIEHLSIWGAFSGVLFSTLALYFLMYNRNTFYTRLPKWDKFEKTLEEMETDIRGGVSDLNPSAPTDGVIKTDNMRQPNRSGIRLTSADGLNRSGIVQ